MNKITYKRISFNRITDHFLNGYIRFQETYQVFYLEDGILKQKEDYFVEDWDQKKLISISRYLKEIVKKGGTLFAAYDQLQIVGFAIIDNNRFGDYINLPYIHSSRGYRGYGIGRYLFNLVSAVAIKKGAKKLYISTHPAYESQKFYQKIGCELAEEINKELYELEPYDVQLEKKLDYIEIITSLIGSEFKNQGRVNAMVINRTASMFYQYLPTDEKLFLDICERFLSIENYGFFSVSTLWMKRRTSIIRKDNMEHFEKILYKDIQGWAKVDQYCYRVLNPMIELDKDHYSYLMKWSNSDNKDIRRASLVSMIISSRRQTLEYDFDRMIFLVDKLKKDKDYHVRKGVGWVLKCAYLKYPDQVENYLRNNVSSLDRMIFRYALEHVEEPLRSELIKL